MNTLHRYLQKTFLWWYDPLPTTIRQQQQDDDDNNNKNNATNATSFVVTDAAMPETPEEAMELLLLQKRKHNNTQTQTQTQTQTHLFPPSFLWGAATAAYQTEGGLHHCNWSEWEQQQQQHGHKQERAGKACDSWNLFESKDLQHLQELGVTVYRFSVDWSRVEPTQGQFDDKAIQRYQSWCQKLQAANIEPMITLHHFTEPAWFTRMGGWEDRNNLQYFERFVQTVGQALASHHCRYWTTVNELNGYAVCGWLAGVHPPGKVNDVLGMLRVVRHLLVAHTMASKAIRASSASRNKGQDPVICMALNHVYFLPFFEQNNKTSNSDNNPLQENHRWWWFLHWQQLLRVVPTFINKILSSLVSLFLNYVYNFVILDALFSPQHAGRFPIFPFPFHIVATLAGWGDDLRALKGTADWIGINHYYRSYVQFFANRQHDTQSHDQQHRQASPTDMFVALPFGIELRASAMDHFEKNEMGWDVTPSSMERLIQILWDRYQPIPMIITESGTADATDRQRVRYIAAILYMLRNKLLLQRQSNAIDIRGYLIWTLMDNFEWAEGYKPKFGLLETNFDTTASSLERKERTWTCNLLRQVFPKDS